MTEDRSKRYEKIDFLGEGQVFYEVMITLCYVTVNAFVILFLYHTNRSQKVKNNGVLLTC